MILGLFRVTTATTFGSRCVREYTSMFECTRIFITGFIFIYFFCFNLSICCYLCCCCFYCAALFMWPLAFHAHLSFLSSINNGTLSVCCRLAVPVLCRTVLLFSSINIIGSHFYIVTIINVYGVSVYFVKISTKCFFWLPFSFMRMIFVCFFCFVLFVSIIVGDAIEIDYFLIVVPIATFLSTCWYSFSLVRLLLYF